jgi:two-component system copper resistance phosphate regulon response regulator CusR
LSSATLEGDVDDFMTKPILVEELIARVRLRLHTSGATTTEPSTLRVNGLFLDLLTRRAQVADRTVNLSPREFALLEILMRHAGWALSREQILHEVWGFDFDPGSNVVDVYISQLRRKLGAKHINTVRGIGYRCG